MKKSCIVNVRKMNKYRYKYLIDILFIPVFLLVLL